MSAFSTTQISSLLLLVFTFLYSGFSEARDHVISAWKIPNSDSDSFNSWAEKSRFLVGDSLVLKYDGTKDSVLEVNRRDYINCNTSDPIGLYAGGNTTVGLLRSGPYYFISGAEGHCQKGQKLIVVVMSEKHRRLISPAPSPSEVDGPAVAPAPSSGAGSPSGGGYLMSVVVLGALFVVGM